MEMKEENKVEETIKELIRKSLDNTIIPKEEIYKFLVSGPQSRNKYASKQEILQHLNRFNEIEKELNGGENDLKGFRQTIRDYINAQQNPKKYFDELFQKVEENKYHLDKIVLKEAGELPKEILERRINELSIEFENGKSVDKIREEIQKARDEAFENGMSNVEINEVIQEIINNRKKKISENIVESKETEELPREILKRRINELSKKFENRKNADETRQEIQKARDEAFANGMSNVEINEVIQEIINNRKKKISENIAQLKGTEERTTRPSKKSPEEILVGKINKIKEYYEKGQSIEKTNEKIKEAMERAHKNGKMKWEDIKRITRDNFLNNYKKTERAINSTVEGIETVMGEGKPIIENGEVDAVIGEIAGNLALNDNRKEENTNKIGEKVEKSEQEKLEEKIDTLIAKIEQEKNPIKRHLLSFKVKRLLTRLERELKVINIEEKFRRERYKILKEIDEIKDDEELGEFNYPELKLKLLNKQNEKVVLKVNGYKARITAFFKDVKEIFDRAMEPRNIKEKAQKEVEFEYNDKLYEIYLNREELNEKYRNEKNELRKRYKEEQARLEEKAKLEDVLYRNKLGIINGMYKYNKETSETERTESFRRELANINKKYGRNNSIPLAQPSGEEPAQVTNKNDEGR